MSGILLFLCLALVILAVILFKGEVIAPSFLLSSAFLISSLDLFINRNEWYFSDKQTVLLIFFGILFFEIGSFIENIIQTYGKRTSYRNRERSETSVSSISLVVYLLAQIILYSFIVSYVCHAMGTKVSFAGLSTAIGGYYEATQSEAIAGLPGYLNIGQIVNTSGIYYLLFLLVSRFVNKQKIPVVLYLNLILGVCGSLLTGTKTSFFMYLVALVVLYFFLKGNDPSKIQKISVKSIIEISLAIVVVIGGFTLLTVLQGRTLTSINMMETISTYIGAPIKNLEIFVTTRGQDVQIFGAQTFEDTYKWLYKMTNNGLFKIDNLYQYNWIIDKGLGNVYTIFMPLFNDFGFGGAYLVMFLLGIFCQFCYNAAKFKKSRNPVNFKIIFYSYLSFAIAFSFFSNKMFEMVFSRSGIYFIVGLFVFDIALRGLSLKAERSEKS